MARWLVQKGLVSSRNAPPDSLPCSRFWQSLATTVASGAVGEIG
jgi:hypothetical protein